MRARLFFRALLTFSLTVLASRLAVAQVRVWQDTLTLPTYEEAAPDPNPQFDEYATSLRFNYPYTLRDNLTGAKSMHSWRAVFLENEYLKCAVLPDLGGHLYTCVDKISGQPFFYANPSVKKAQIGYRGAWAAFGVEFNFPVSHNWVSLSPVDFAYASHPDGSASVWVGNIDRPYGMQWQVELVMRPGSTLLEQRVTLFNRSDIRHRYYWWNNASVQVWDDSRIDYPMRFVASHGFTEVSRWPVGVQGTRDISIIANQTLGAVSSFAHGSNESFMGIWNPKTQTGTAHFAEFRDVPGKKIWSWGTDPDGLNWRKVLSDNDSAYVEVQSGLFRNQETYSFLEPGQALHFSEYWMPVRAIGGISRANKFGILHFNRSDSGVSVELNVNQRIQGARISLKSEGAAFLNETADLAPEKTWSHTIPSPVSSGKLAFELRDSGGQLLLQQTEGEYDWDPESSIKVGPQPTTRLPDPEQRSADDWLQAGRDEESNGASLSALATYRQALAHFPQSLSLAIAAGRLAASLQQYEDAERLLRPAQMRDTTNSEIAYYLGIAEEGLGHPREAETSYEIAYRQADLRAAAAIRLAEMRARQHDLQSAASLLRAATVAQPDNLRADEELEAVLRAAGEQKAADELAGLRLAADPTSDFLKVDSGSMDAPHLAADPYRVLRVADEYIRLGLCANALNLLDRDYPAVAADQSEPGSVLPQGHPLVRYYSAYCHQQLHDGVRPGWEAASRLSTSYVFPSTETDRLVLEAAVTAQPDDATAHYLLGTLLFAKGSADAAMSQWADAKRLDPNRPMLDVDIGDALLRLKNAPHGAVAAFREGLRNDSENPQVYAGLDQAMSLEGASAPERAAALSQYPFADAPQSKMPADLVYQLALTRAEAKQFEQALALFGSRFFPSEENGISSDQVRFEIEEMQAEVWAEAGGCARVTSFLNDNQAEKSLEGRSARDYFHLAILARTCGQAVQAREFFRKAAVNENPESLVWAIRAEEALGSGKAESAHERLKRALIASEGHPEVIASSGWRCYNAGMLELALGNKEQAKSFFAKALIMPDAHMSHHLIRQALATINDSN